MARKNAGPKVNRRAFLTGIAVAGAGAAAAVKPSLAATAEKAAPPRRPSALRPSAQLAANETQVPAAAHAENGGAPGSDFMVDVIKSLKVDYITSNPASSFRGLHESLINYGKNKNPEFITVNHEEIGVAMAHGYFKVTGKPLMTLCHGTVGLQHASMAIYNAWCDRVPVIVVGGNDLDATKRPPGVPTYHSAQDINALVRDFTKWDDNPVSLPHFAESLVRAYKLAMTPPYEPVALALDAELQEEPMGDREKLVIPRYRPTAPPQGDANAVREAGKLLAAAQRPVIVVDKYARTPAAIPLLIQLAELLNAQVVDQRGRMNLPNTHYLSRGGRGPVGQADVVLGLEVSDFWSTVNQYIDNGEGLRESTVKPGTKLISISAGGFYIKSNYQDFQRFQDVDVDIAADAEATMPALIEAVKSALTAEQRAGIEKKTDALKKGWADGRQRNLQAATLAWDASPISTARLAAEVWAVTKGLPDWSFIGADGGGLSGWVSRLWSMEKHHHHMGGPGGYGLGYNLPAAVGVALGNKAQGRITVNIQSDGDFMYAPGALWTAAREHLPLLSVMHNNRGYHQEVMHVQRMSNRRDRVAFKGKDSGPLGTCIQNPDIDFAKIAQGMGVWATGPIENPAELGPALKKAVQVVMAGEPALVDVVTQPR